MENNKKDGEEETCCNINTRLLPYKANYFCFFAARGALVPFLAIYMREIGFDAGQIGLISLPRPFGGFLGALFSGYISPGFITERNLLSLSVLMDLVFFSIAGIVTTGPEHTAGNNNCSYEQPSKATYHLPSQYSSAYSQGDMLRNFAVLSVCICLAEAFYSSSQCLMNSLTMSILGRGSYDEFGLQRTWGALGHGLLALITGCCINWTVQVYVVCGHPVIVANYHILFYIYAFLCCLTVLNSRNLQRHKQGAIESDMPVDADKPCNHGMTFADVSPYLLNLKNGAWLLMVFCRSAFFGATQAFLYWHLSNLGASPFLVGSANFVTTATEFVMFFFSPWVLRKFGYNKVVYFGLTSYAIRFLVFANVSRPWLIVPVEILEGITYAFFWSAMVAYLSSAVPPEGLLVTQGIFSSLVTLGTGLGYLFSGLLTQWYGAPIMFMIFALLATSALIMFVASQTLASKSNYDVGT